MSERAGDSELLADPYLSPSQQDLLLRALESQSEGHFLSPASHRYNHDHSPSHATEVPSKMSIVKDDGLFMSPQNAELDSSYLDYTPDLDYLEGGESFDFENADLGGDMIGALPGAASGSKEDIITINGDGHEKRKNPDEGDDAEGGDAKRQETQEGEKGAKKPGRKPLTNEPTTKRKAQNRAAQRAFRERKEKHLKDLETKVSELTKSSEADKHENGLLKAQVERLQVELREYRKRLSLNSGLNRSPPQSASVGSQQRSSSGASFNGGFQFDFPKFGALPGSQIFGSPFNGVINRDSLTPPISQSPASAGGYSQQPQNRISRQNSAGRSASPHSNGDSNSASPAQYASMNATFAPYSTNNNMHGFASTLPQMTNASDPFGDLFSPSILKGTNVSGYFEDPTTNTVPNSGTDTGGDSTSGLNRVFQFNSGSNASDSTSPSASSSSQWNANGTSNSSCETSPEPSHDSPANKDTNTALYAGDATSRRQNDTSSRANTGGLGFGTTFGFDNADYSAPSMSQFDPVLFGDYRESNDAIVGAGDFSGGFFDDALNTAPFDYGSPSNLFGILQSPQQTHASTATTGKPPNTHAQPPSKALMAEMEKARDGGDDDYGLPSAQAKKNDEGKLISCNNIWNQLQKNPDFQDGKFDLDNLCSELRAKARCSESGVMVDQNYVDAAFKKLSKKDDANKADMPSLMFEQSSWDNVLKKLQKGGN